MNKEGIKTNNRKQQKEYKSSLQTIKEGINEDINDK